MRNQKVNHENVVQRVSSRQFAVCTTANVCGHQSVFLQTFRVKKTELQSLLQPNRNLKKEKLYATTTYTFFATVVFNIFRAATDFANQFNPTTLPKISIQAYVMQLCLQKITMTNVQPTLNYQIHAHGIINERDPCRIQITSEHNSLKTRITVKLATALIYLIY